MKKLLSLTLILISVVLLQCSKKDKGEPPVLPPQESMTIDFSNFSTLKKSADLQTGQKGTESTNWEFAESVARIFKSKITILAVPVAAYKLAINQTPVYLSEKNWQWSYTVNVANVTYKARLTGLIGASDVTWKMYITKEGTDGFAEFLWFEGTSKSDGTGGQWIFYESPQSGVALLQIDWTTGTSVSSVKYTIMKTGTNKNNYIEYGDASGALYDAYYKISYSDIRGTFTVNVEWNTTTYIGRVKCLGYLGDTNWYCWDTNKINALCP
jgi:hypothetical protein